MPLGVTLGFGGSRSRSRECILRISFYEFQWAAEHDRLVVITFGLMQIDEHVRLLARLNREPQVVEPDDDEAEQVDLEVVERGLGVEGGWPGPLRRSASSPCRACRASSCRRRRPARTGSADRTA
jgi:hypothetical protein